MWEIFDTPLSEIGLSKRVVNALRQTRGIEVLGELLSIPETSLRWIPGIGRKAIEEILEKTRKYRLYY